MSGPATDAPAPDDPRYLEGARLFNARAWFEAHEVWEHLWHDDPTPARRFYQGLIMAAVALEHWRRGNPRGAASQWHQGRAFLQHFRPRHLGLDVKDLIVRMDAVLAPVMTRTPDQWRDAAAHEVPPFDENEAPRVQIDVEELRRPRF